MERLSEKEWKDFSYEKFFALQKQKNKLSVTDCTDEGLIPVYASQSQNNGVMGFTTAKQEIDVKQYPYLVFGDHTRCMNLAKYSFSAADNVKILKTNELSMDELTFIATAWKKRIPDMGYARHWRKARTVGISLPVDDTGNPDYAYMTIYSTEVRGGMLMRYKNFITGQLSQLEYKDIPALGEKKWKPIPIVSLFKELKPGKGHGLNHLTKINDGISYIGATNRDNGVLCFIQEDEMSRNMKQPGNCIGFIKNGDGSAGYAIYKAEPFVSTSDVIYGYANWLNRYTGLFFVAAQDLIEHKYSHGYKRNQQHLRGDKVMLPVTDAGKPDYEYMEQYAKNMMLHKYEQYLAFIESGR
ncbi:hypothetical protein [Pseudoramibacter alactolyticus]|uniref:hypothetical protein n=1 Tax=Pseudoramibacter alactolyticus TaxID=113287 RepID=UPI0028F0F6F4|nr:hypothetical protein [Pseudoramibacter alactolyticus]